MDSSEAIILSLGKKTSLENPETIVERRAPSIPDSWEASRAPPRGGPPPRSGRTARLFAVARMGARVSRVFVHGVRLGVPRARRAEANEATFAPDVETKNIPQGADADGLKSAMRALGDRRVKRPRPARSRTCTLDSLHVCLSHALDVRSDALPRRLSLRARRSRAVRRACFFPRETGPMPSSAVRARDVPCDATCRASHDDAHNPSWFRPSRP